MPGQSPSMMQPPEQRARGTSRAPDGRPTLDHLGASGGRIHSAQRTLVRSVSDRAWLG
jgi:hypothetical protein